MAIEPGTLVEAVTASGEAVQLRALGTPVEGVNFPVVWVCTEEEYVQGQEAGEPVRGIPWPLDEMKELEPS